MRRRSWTAYSFSKRPDGKTLPKYAQELVVLVSVLAFITGCAADMAFRGQRALHSGNYQKAIEEFTSCVETEGDTGELASHCSFMLGKAYFDKGQYPPAIVHLKRAIDIYKKGMFVSHLDTAWHFWLGRAHYEIRQYKEAIVQFHKAASMAVQDPKTLMPVYASEWRKTHLPLIPPKSGCYFWLGTAYHRNGQNQEAVGAFRQSIELDPTATDAYTMLAAAHRNLGQNDEGIAAVKRSIEIKPNDFAYGVLASIHANKKQYGEAVAARKKAIELNPKSAGLYFHLAETYREGNHYAEAAQSYKKGLTIAPNDINGLFPLATAYMAMGQFQEAINTLDQVLSLMTITGVGMQIAQEEGYPVVQAVMESGPAQKAGVRAGDRIIRIDGKPMEGLSIEKVSERIRGAVGTPVVFTISRKSAPMEMTLTRAKIVPKGAAGPLGVRSIAQRALGKHGAAHDDAEKGYSIDQNDPWGWAQSAMSVSYMDKGRYAEALTILSKRKDSDFERMLEASVRAKLGDMKKAVEIYGSIPEHYFVPDNVLRQSFKNAFLESLRPYVNTKKGAARSLEAKGQYKEALAEYIEILKIADEKDAKEMMDRVASIIKTDPRAAELPEAARRHVMRAEVSTKEGKFEDAVREYKEAAKMAPFFPALYKALALNYAEMKQYRQAIHHLKTYLVLYPDASDARTAKDEIYKWEFLMEKGAK